MNRRLYIGIGAGLLCILFLLAVAGEAPRKRVTVGVLQFTANNLPTYEGFREAMEDFGYTGESAIRYVFDGPAATRDELEPRMARLLDAKPDLIFASPTPAAAVAGEMTRETGIPVVFAPVNDPVSAGIVQSITRPEANLTGVRLSASDGRRLQSLLEIFPSVRRVLVPYSPDDRSAEASIAMLREASDKLGVTLLLKPFAVGTELSPESEYIPAEADAVLLPRDGRVMARIRDFSEICILRKIPLSTPRYRQVEQGAVVGYGFMGYEIGRQAARLAHMILSGTPVSSLPVETSRDYLFINLRSAEAMGVTIDDAVLRRAHRIIR